MERRGFFGSLVAMVAGLFVREMVEPQQPSLTPIYKRVGGHWQRCRMFELVPGDYARFDCEHGKTYGVIKTQPMQLEDGVWSVNVEEPS